METALIVKSGDKSIAFNILLFAIWFIYQPPYVIILILYNITMTNTISKIYINGEMIRKNFARIGDAYETR